MMEALPPRITKLDALQTLDVSSNRLRDLPGWLTQLGQLTTLNLAMNPLGTLPATLFALTRLKTLSIRKCELKSLPDEIGSLARLQELDFSGNSLTTLPVGLGKLRLLRKVRIEDNPFEVVQQVRHQGRWRREATEVDTSSRIPPTALTSANALLDYLRLTFQQGKQPCYRIRLMVAGQENVGKSSLLHYLITKKEKKKNLSTDGVEVQVWNPAGDKKKKNAPEFVCWDLAGQDIYYSTHQFFLVARSLYLVVFDLTNPNPERIDYWLQLLSARVPTAVVVLVGTHLDDPRLSSQAAVDGIVNDLKQRTIRFKNIASWALVSCRNGKGMKELKHELITLAEKQDFFQEMIPNAIIELEKKIVALRGKLKLPVSNWPNFVELVCWPLQPPHQLTLVTPLLPAGDYRGLCGRRGPSGGKVSARPRHHCLGERGRPEGDGCAGLPVADEAHGHDRIHQQGHRPQGRAQVRRPGSPP
jgi:GTPase SAR1 family protein